MWQNLYLYIANDLSFRAELSLQRVCHLLRNVARRDIARQETGALEPRLSGVYSFSRIFIFFLDQFSGKWVGFFFQLNFKIKLN